MARPIRYYNFHGRANRHRMKKTTSLKILCSMSLPENRLNLHPNEGADLGLMTARHSVAIGEGERAEIFLLNECPEGKRRDRLEILGEAGKAREGGPQLRRNHAENRQSLDRLAWRSAYIRRALRLCSRRKNNQTGDRKSPARNLWTRRASARRSEVAGSILSCPLTLNLYF